MTRIRLVPVYLLLALEVGLLVLLFSACQGETDQRYRLTSFERRRLDTLYDAELSTLRPMLDSICTVNYNQGLQPTIDSLVRRGRIEAEALRQRNPLE